MLSAVGAKSMALPREMVRRKLAEPGRFASSSGQHARAWSLAELIRIRAAIEFAEETGFSQAATCAILQGVGRSMIDLALAIGPTASLLTERRIVWSKASGREQNLLQKKWGETPVNVCRPSVVDILIENRRYISLVGPDPKHQGKYRSWELGTLLNAKSKTPTMVVDWKELEDPNPYVERSQLKVHIPTLCTQLVSEVTGFEVHWEFAATL